jgi:arsenate reductase
MTTGGRPGKVSIDQQLALKAAAARIKSEFGDGFDLATITYVLQASHDQFTGDSAIMRFLQAERFARQRLRALTRVLAQRVDGTPAAVFLSVHNTGRSPMALGFFQHLAEDRAVGWSAGSQPGHEMNPAVVAAMRDRGIGLSREFPKPWTSEVIHAADVVITMGCRDVCPVLPGKHYVDWEIDNPAGLSVDDVRTLRDEVERRVRVLLDDLGVPTRKLPADPHFAGR